MKKLIINVFLFVFSFSTISLSFSKLPQLSNKDFILTLKKIVKTKVQLYQTPFGRMAFFQKKGKSFFGIFTPDYAKVNGYIGPTALAMILDARGKKIVWTNIVASLDTPSYVNFAKNRGLLKKVNPSKRLFLKRRKNIKLDSVSGATITSKAVEKTINLTLRKILKVIRSFQVKRNKLISSRYKIKKIN